jgi:hypothetical protein
MLQILNEIRSDLAAVNDSWNILAFRSQVAAESAPSDHPSPTTASGQTATVVIPQLLWLPAVRRNQILLAGNIARGATHSPVQQESWPARLQ